MRDYWLTQYFLAAIGWGYLIIVLIALGLALWLAKGKTAKTIAALVILAMASILPFKGYQEYAKEKQAANAYKARYAKAKALFDERCKTAGEKIYRTVENVEGLLLTKLRPVRISDTSQYDTDDQYGYNVGGEEYVRYYLIGSSDLTSRYRFVEAPTEKFKLRFTTPLSAEKSREYWVKGGGKVIIESKDIETFSAQYAVEWQDVSTKEDRDSWIAGGALRVTDRKTGEILGERVGYLLETGFGSTAGQRSPWSWARYYAKSCPTLNEHNRIFVEKVLKPIKGE